MEVEILNSNSSSHSTVSVVLKEQARDVPEGEKRESLSLREAVDLFLISGLSEQAVDSVERPRAN